ncbi:MAG: nuclear transport factor 2 family protein [Byssovorax sp.]
MDHPHVATLRTWFHRLLVDRDYAVIETLRDDRSESEGIAPELVRGVPDFRRLHQALAAIARITKVEITEAVIEGDHVAILVCASGATTGGKPFRLEGAAFLDFEGGKIRRARNLWSTGALAEALGVSAALSLDEIAVAAATTSAT